MSATSPADLRQHLEEPTQFHSIFDDADGRPKDKQKNLNFSLGVSTSGLSLELLKKNVIKNEDFLKFAFNMNQQKEKAYSFTFMQPFSTSFLPDVLLHEAAILPTKLEASYSFEIDTKQTKYESREQSHSLLLSSPDSPWSLRFEGVVRKNKIDRDASKYFLLNESLPSAKFSTTIGFTRLAENMMTRVNTELALPLIADRCASFLKVEAKHQQKWTLIKDKLNFVIDLQGGVMSAAAIERTSFVNDRFYLHNTSGYLALGHEERSNMPPDVSDTK